MKTLVLLSLSALLLSGCASTQRCEAKADYRKAAAIPPIKAAEGLKLPESASALKVPDLTPAAIAAAQQPGPKKGRGTACLDYPPEIVPAEAASGGAKS